MADDAVGGVKADAPKTDVTKAPTKAPATSTFRVLANHLKNPALANALRVHLKLRKDQLDDEIPVDAFNSALAELNAPPAKSEE